MSKSRFLAYLALLGNTILWAAAIPLAKRGFDDGLSTQVFLFFRFAVALVASLPLLLTVKKAERKRVFQPKNLFMIIFLELLGTFLSLWLLYEGVFRTSSVEASLISITWPIFVIIGGVLFLGERESRNEFIGLIVIILGTLLVVIRPLLNHGYTQGSLFGNLLIIGQNLTIAIYYLLAKHYYHNLNKWLTVHLSFFVGVIAFGAVGIYKGMDFLGSFRWLISNPSPWPLIVVVYMGTLGSVVALTLYLIGQDKIEASQAALFTYLQPVFTIPLSIFLVGESVSFYEIFGGLIILYGVYYAQSKSRKKHHFF